MDKCGTHNYATCIHILLRLSMQGMFGVSVSEMALG